MLFRPENNYIILQTMPETNLATMG